MKSLSEIFQLKAIALILVALLVPVQGFSHGASHGVSYNTARVSSEPSVNVEVKNVEHGQCRSTESLAIITQDCCGEELCCTQVCSSHCSSSHSIKYTFYKLNHFQQFARSSQADPFKGQALASAMPGQPFRPPIC